MLLIQLTAIKRVRKFHCDNPQQIQTKIFLIPKSHKLTIWEICIDKRKRILNEYAFYIATNEQYAHIIKICDHLVQLRENTVK